MTWDARVADVVAIVERKIAEKESVRYARSA
jgi:hypothetical protein